MMSIYKITWSRTRISIDIKTEEIVLLSSNVTILIRWSIDQAGYNIQDVNGKKSVKVTSKGNKIMR